ncbi:YHYH protein [Ilumatobacter sp.]|uniref:YHYH protein n=1 Tax=Ilumatobacter sp. TaxID=1967498 RepID=UPI0030B1C9CA
MDSQGVLEQMTGMVVDMKATIPRRRSVLALSLAATLAFAACGSDEPAAEDTTAPAEVAPAEVAPADTEVADTEVVDTEVPATMGDPDTDYTGSYALADEEFGTMTTVTVADGHRTIVSNALPDHEVGEFPNPGNPNTISEQNVSYEYPADPVYVGSATNAMTPGVAVNGLKFEPATAETVTCESGETFRVEALQDIYDLGLDFNNAHVQPTGEYHYHGISELLANAYSTDNDLVHVGFAADGFFMYYSKSGVYSPSYSLSTDARSGTDCVGSMALGGDAVEVEGTMADGTYAADWQFSDANGNDNLFLDECNGTEIDGTYAYVITDEYPFISRCLNGEFTATGPGGGGGEDAAGAEGAAPDLSEAAATLGVTQQELQAALGGPPPDFDAAAETLGVTVDELQAALPDPGGAPQG